MQQRQREVEKSVSMGQPQDFARNALQRNDLVDAAMPDRFIGEAAPRRLL
jgi:hypothetical protein